jgi:hypothetical protein
MGARISLVRQNGIPPSSNGAGGLKKKWHGPVAPALVQSASLEHWIHVSSTHR